jgi:dTDP-4-amino-4,6-dideoxygalactose transaminase
VLDDANYIFGDYVSAFGNDFSHFCGVKLGTRVSFGMAALNFDLLAALVEPGDEVIAERIRMLRDHGQSVKNVHQLIGYNPKG